ncbi:MAG: recombinase family protein [Mogibacterium sp.]|nr:recombinase family protein [Mogibacterium sp.]
MPKITRLQPAAVLKRPTKRVAAYARVSKETARTMHSLSSQISYYNKLIQSNPEWEFAGVYADEAISGTGTEKREAFRSLINDCEAGRIDIVLTKSISRFARNTVDLLETVRHLKDIGVEVRFEKESINSLTADGELMLTILASFAQAEVETMSQNIKWTIRRRFQKGQLNGCCSFLGYRWDDSQKKLIVVPDEAELVRRIFNMYLSGKSLQQIVNALDDGGISGKRGGRIQKTTVSQVLQNISYTGNLLLQKTYSSDPLTKKERKNNGELPQYYSENTHEAIIDMATFQAVQKRLEHMQEVRSSECYEERPFTRKLVCNCCSSWYTRKRTKKSNGNMYYAWICWRHKEYGSKECPGRAISEKKLMAYSCDVLGWDSFDGDAFRDLVDKVIVKEEGLEFFMSDGSRKEVADVKCHHYSGKDR